MNLHFPLFKYNRSLTTSKRPTGHQSFRTVRLSLPEAYVITDSLSLCTSTFAIYLSLSMQFGEVDMGAKDENPALIFTYGTLKQGFSNHGLIQEMVSTGDAAYLGVYRTVEKLPLVCGPYRVPFLLNLPGSGDRVTGELYAVSSRGLGRMDELEGTSRGHYERLPVRVEAAVEASNGAATLAVDAEAYYAHSSYAERLWRRNGEKGLSSYSEKEAKGYVKRNDRPQHLTFLDHIRLFIA